MEILHQSLKLPPSFDSGTVRNGRVGFLRSQFVILERGIDLVAGPGFESGTFGMVTRTHPPHRGEIRAGARPVRSSPPWSSRDRESYRHHQISTLYLPAPLS